MNRESWLEEREKLQSIFDDIERGYIRLARDQDEYLASLKRRIVHLDDKLRRTDLVQD
jgi:hypothetical protein